MKDQIAAANLDDKLIKRQRAIISSMTPQERRNPDVLKASRKKRIAAGSGTKVEEINRLLKQHRQMADMMKSMGGGGKRGPMGKLAQMFGMGGGMPQPTPEQIAEMQKQMGARRRCLPGAAAGAFAGRAACRRACPARQGPGLPGLGGGPKMPGLSGPWRRVQPVRRARRRMSLAVQRDSANASAGGVDARRMRYSATRAFGPSNDEPTH